MGSVNNTSNSGGIKWEHISPPLDRPGSWTSGQNGPMTRRSMTPIVDTRIPKCIVGANLVILAQLHKKFSPKLSQDACLVQIWWFQPKSVTCYHEDKPNFLEFWVKMAEMVLKFNVNDIELREAPFHRAVSGTDINTLQSCAILCHKLFFVYFLHDLITLTS